MPPKRSSASRSSQASKKKKATDSTNIDSGQADSAIVVDGGATSSTAQDVQAEAGVAGQSHHTDSVPHVRVWNNLVYGPDITLGINYLLAGSVPWTEEAHTHVFIPADVNESTLAMPLLHSEMIEVLGDVGYRFRKWCHQSELKQPIVGFDQSKVTISHLSQNLLEDFWRSPPLLRGKPMKLISRGFPHPNLSVYRVQHAHAMTEEELVNQIGAEANEHLKAVVAKVYQIDGIPGGPVSTGFIVCFATDAWYNTRTFLGRRCKPCQYQPDRLGGVNSEDRTSVSPTSQTSVQLIERPQDRR